MFAYGSSRAALAVFCHAPFLLTPLALAFYRRGRVRRSLVKDAFPPFVMFNSLPALRLRKWGRCQIAMRLLDPTDVRQVLATRWLRCSRLLPMADHD
jgi:hypothetical protein